ncbi:Carm1-pending protein [Aphelenchoides bicaudatus]|nr:Carm1-pending protein [Aphelenchoides bicaudatus]
MAEQQQSNIVQLAPTKFCDVDYCELLDEESQSNGNNLPAIQLNVIQPDMALLISPNNENIFLNDPNGKKNRWFGFGSHQISFVSKKFLLIIPKNPNNRTTACLRFHADKEAEDFEKALKLCQLLKSSVSKEKNAEKSTNLFDARTEQNSADLYFQFYGYLNQQQNMLQDFVRTSTYQQAILSNTNDFNGNGCRCRHWCFVILCNPKELVRTNNLNDRITVIPGKVEDIDLQEKGYSLVNERMLESFVFARKFLKPGGKMFPTRSTMYFALFSDELVYQENIQKTVFWFNTSFHGIDISGLRSNAFTEVFKQPVIDTWSSAIICSETTTWSFDFEKDPVEKLHLIEVPFELKITRACLMHGICTWFDVVFDGSQMKIFLSTGPDNPLVSQYQVRYFFTEPFLVHTNDLVTGKIVFRANEKLSYDVDIYANVNGVEKTNNLDLKNPNFRYMASTSGVQMASVNYYDGTMVNNTNVQNAEQQADVVDNNSTTSKMVLTDVATFFYYFAFGSNLLDERIHVQITGAEFESVAYLKNYELAFYDHGSRWQGAVASIEPKNGTDVWGCVWRVPTNASEELDLQESGYHRLNVTVHSIADSSQIECRTYQYSNEKREKKAPSPHYKAVIVAGAIEHQLPGWYVDQLKSIKDNGYSGRVEVDLEVIKDLNQNSPPQSTTPVSDSPPTTPVIATTLTTPTVKTPAA